MNLDKIEWLPAPPLGEVDWDELLTARLNWCISPGWPLIGGGYMTPDGKIVKESNTMAKSKPMPMPMKKGMPPKDMPMKPMPHKGGKNGKGC